MNAIERFRATLPTLGQALDFDAAIKEARSEGAAPRAEGLPTHRNAAGVEFVTVACDDCGFTHAHRTDLAAPRAEGLDVERLRAAVMEGTDPDTGDVWLHREDADILRARLSRPSDERVQ